MLGLCCAVEALEGADGSALPHLLVGRAHGPAQAHLGPPGVDAQRAAVDAWLKTRSELTKAEVSPLMDVWYPEKPINAAK